ncbi:hypothetical protein YYE_04950, partial [Plasmodium vinckei vinckei]
CKLLLEGDSYFNDENVDTKKINEKPTIKGYCSSDVCKTNEDGINALAAYIHSEFKNLIKRQSQYNDYDEYLLMWISDKLLKIHKKKKGKNIGKGRMDAFTLKQAYEDYLEKYKAKLDYWVHLGMMEGLKEANLWYMSEFYKLFNHICNTIVDYETNSAKSKNLSKNSIGCRRQYRTLYMNISECKSYLHLLNKLKGIYDYFRSSAIKKNPSKNDLKTKLIKLTLGNGKEMEVVRGFKTYDFSTEQCKFPIKQKKIVSSKKVEPPGPAPPLQKSQKHDPQSPPKAPEQTKDNKEKIPSPTAIEQSQLQLPNLVQPQEPKLETDKSTSDISQNGESNEQKDPGGDTENQNRPQSDLNNHDQTPVTNKGGSDDGEGVKDSEPGGSGSGSSDQGSNNGGSEDLNGGTGDTDKGPLNTGGGGNGELTGTNTEKGDSEDGLVDKVSEAGDIDNGKDVSKGGKGNVSGGDQKSPDGSGDSGSISDGGAGGTNSRSGNQTKGSENSAPASDGTGIPQSPGTSTTTPVTSTELKDTQNGVKNPQDNMQTGLNNIKDPKGGPSNQQTTQGGKQVDQNGAPGSSGGESKDNPQMKTNQAGDSPSMPQIPGSENQGTKQGVVNQHQDPNSKQGVSGGTGDPVNVPDGGQGSGQDSGVHESGGPGVISGDQSVKDSQEGIGDGKNEQRSKSGASGDGSGGSSNMQPEPSKGKGSLGGEPGGAAGGKGGSSGGPDGGKGDPGTSPSTPSPVQPPAGSQSPTVSPPVQQSDPSPPVQKPDPQLPSGSPSAPQQDPEVPPPVASPIQTLSQPTPPQPVPPESPPASPPEQPQPQNPQLPSSPTTIQQKQPSPQPQPNTLPPQKVDQPNHKTNVQLVKSPSSDHIFIKPWNIIPTTWNGSEDCKPKIKFMSTTLVCCTSKQCSLTGVSVTLILIPIILLIAYKCLSIGSSKKSEKKNMKRVINFHDGNRKTKIIISSNDRIKHIKPVINSVGRKKDPLLNIYKIMQADPAPFINLFFLLIFFVYKRKRDFIEL